MRSKIQLRLFIGMLLVVGLGLTVYKHVSVGYPLVPKQQIPLWTIEARIQFRAAGGPVKVTLAVPGEQPRLGILEEIGTSPDYGFTPALPAAEDQNLYRTVVWSRDDARGKQELFYRIEVYKKPQRDALSLKPAPAPRDPRYDEPPLSVAADAAIRHAKRYSAEVETFVSQLIQILMDPSNQNGQLLVGSAENDLQRMRVVRELTVRAGYEAHLVRGLELGESSRSQSLVTGVLVVAEGRPLIFEWGQPQPATRGDFLVWQRGGPALLEVRGGRNAKVSFSVLKRQLPAAFVLEEAALRKEGGVAGFSLSSLSIEQQNSYRLLLMIPFGALVVVIMRNIVGIKTSGTFMPILLAMAFLKTTLLSGIILFVIVVSVGLMMRSYLSRLDLLLVPRISAVVVVVIGIMVAFGVLGAKFELPIASSVTLFPTIILAWTVERLSVLWEEDGVREVATQTGGSLLVAVLAYAVMGSETLRYQVFIFPELILVVLAVILALGQYAGYRVSELIRFAPLAKRGTDTEAS